MPRPEDQWKEMLARSFNPRQWFDGELPGWDEGAKGVTLMWVYRQEGNGKFLVGYYDPTMTWHLDSEQPSRDLAVSRVHFLNGGEVAAAP